MKINEQLAQLLGLGSTAEWPYSEKSLMEMVQLQREKEITKQQYYKLENTNKSIELLNLALNSQVPNYLIPIIFSGESLSEDLMQKLASSQQSQPIIPQRNNTPAHGQQSPSRQLYANYQQQPSEQSHPHQQQLHHQQQQPGSSNLGPPVSFHRPLSPAKIGAAAVAQLDGGRYPTSPIHKRNHSMPVHSGNVSLNSTPVPIVTVIHSPSLRQINGVSNNTSGPKNQQSMMGTMSSIQFINENPGKKRRRASLDLREQIGEDSIVEEEIEDKENDKKLPRRKTHTRTRSDNFLWEKHTPSATATPKKIVDDRQVKEETVSTRSATPQQTGPKFANNILSSA